MGLIATLSHWVGWRSTYGASTSNIDIWLLSMLKSVTVAVLIHLGPKTVDRAKGDDGTSTIHKRVSKIEIYQTCCCPCMLTNCLHKHLQWDNLHMCVSLSVDINICIPLTRVPAQLRSGVRYTCIAVQLLLLAKASIVAVLSPDDLWPISVQQPARVDFVGLIYMCVHTI